MARERWSENQTFVIAAVGSAIGLGNVWRFPYMAYSNGGGAFFIPYVIALLTTGIPLLALEFYLGARSQGGPTKAFTHINPRANIVGWFSIMVAFVVTVYYAVIMAWAWNYLYYSLGMKWAGQEKEFFFNKVLGISENIESLGGLKWPLVVGNIITWIAIYFIIRKGTESVGKVVKWTVLLPWFLLAVLIIRGVTLPGAFAGLEYYLSPNFSHLLNPSVWLSAYGQIFFSLSLGFGIMIAYASYLPKDADINTNAWSVSIANSLTSFFAGFAVFTVLGYLALSTGTEVSQAVEGGPGLAFVVYPTVLATLPGGLIVQSIFGAAFFIMLLCLGIDSAFSLVEGASTGIQDAYPQFSRKKATIGLCVVGALGGLLFATGSGLYWLDIVDHWMNWGLIIAGLAEVILIGWFFDIRSVEKDINSSSKIKTSRFWFFCIKYWTPLALSTLLISNIVSEIQKPYEGYPLWTRLVGGWLLLVLIFALAIAIERHSSRANQ